MSAQQSGPTTWLHSRKGRVVGEAVGQDDTWVHIRLAQAAWADVRRRHLCEAGSVQTYRRSLLTPIEGGGR